jgi:hypothetical protein
MLRLYLHLKTRDAFLEGVINFFWRKLDDSTLALKTRELLLHPCPSTLDCCTSSDKGLSPQDRYNLLSMESKSLLELGSRSDKALNIVLSCFDQAKKDLGALVGEQESRDGVASRKNIRVYNPMTSLRQGGRPQTKRIESTGKHG